MEHLNKLVSQRKSSDLLNFVTYVCGMHMCVLSSPLLVISVMAHAEPDSQPQQRLCVKETK